ncbi:MAG: 4-hydroxybenzoate octaprenyltransferase [Ignavibacteriales bacterium]|nr:4-hydroxybenzoate octaprenyltransferase [Ignavibacteriales bacterium]
MRKFLQFVKFEHTLFTLPLIYSGVVLGSHSAPSVTLLILVFIAAVGARTIAFALNRIIDKEIDFRNPRTADRELPSGRMNMREASIVFISGCITYFGAAILISKFCFLLSPIPLMVFVTYPYMKRFTVLAHFGVGLGMAMAPLGGWFAVSPSFENMLPAILLSFFTIMWGAGFDIIYATLDEEFDKKENLYSFVSRFGKSKALRYSTIFHLIGFIGLAYLFVVSIQTFYALPFLLLTGVLLWIEHVKAMNVDLAFFKINAVLGFVVFAMIMTGAMLR